MAVNCDLPTDVARKVPQYAQVYGLELTPVIMLAMSASKRRRQGKIIFGPNLGRRSVPDRPEYCSGPK